MSNSSFTLTQADLEKQISDLKTPQALLETLVHLAGDQHVESLRVALLTFVRTHSPRHEFPESQPLSEICNFLINEEPDSNLLSALSDISVLWLSSDSSRSRSILLKHKAFEILPSVIFRYILLFNASVAFHRLSVLCRVSRTFNEKINEENRGLFPPLNVILRGFFDQYALNEHPPIEKCRERANTIIVNIQNPKRTAQNDDPARTKKCKESNEIVTIVQNSRYRFIKRFLQLTHQRSRHVSLCFGGTNFYRFSEKDAMQNESVLAFAVLCESLDMEYVERGKREDALWKLCEHAIGPFMNVKQLRITLQNLEHVNRHNFPSLERIYLSTNLSSLASAMEQDWFEASMTSKICTLDCMHLQDIDGVDFSTYSCLEKLIVRQSMQPRILDVQRLNSFASEPFSVGSIGLPPFVKQLCFEKEVTLCDFVEYFNVKNECSSLKYLRTLKFDVENREGLALHAQILTQFLGHFPNVEEVGVRVAWDSQLAGSSLLEGMHLLGTLMGLAGGVLRKFQEEPTGLKKMWVKTESAKIEEVKAQLDEVFLGADVVVFS